MLYVIKLVNYRIQHQIVGNEKIMFILIFKEFFEALGNISLEVMRRLVNRNYVFSISPVEWN